MTWSWPAKRRRGGQRELPSETVNDPAGYGVNESIEEKRLMRAQIAEAKARFQWKPIPWLDQVGAREFFAALGITEMEIDDE